MSADTVDLAEDEFVVARIAGMKNVEGTRYFLIEWEGYEKEDNTWESQDNVHSKETIDAFVAAYKRQARPPKSNRVLNIKTKILLKDTYDPDTQTYYEKAQVAKKTLNGSAALAVAQAQAAQAAATQRNNTVAATQTTHLKQSLVSALQNDKNLVTTNNIKSHHNNHNTTTLTSTKSTTTKTKNSSKKRVRELIESETESVLVSKPLKEARLGLKKLSIEVCKAFEYKMEKIKQTVEQKYPIVRMPNHLLNKRPVYEIKNLKAKVTVVNEIDSDLPTNFVYIDDLKYTSPVQPPDPNFLPGCQCQKAHGEDCSMGCHDTIAYDNHGRLIINQGTAIYECNTACDCDKNCKNRVVQRGRKMPLQVFKTRQKGWGVRSTQFIPKGTFIEEYIGEVIQVDEGDSRGQVYDKLGCTYLFDMDFAQSELPTKYVIDSYTLGNVSRFFNHSCSPNLEVYAVFYDSADNQMHRLAFFAKRDIQKDEELCFDYNGRNDVSNLENVDASARYSCHCDAVECRKWIYH